MEIAATLPAARLRPRPPRPEFTPAALRALQQAPPRPRMPRHGGPRGPRIRLLLLFAVLGGLILNLMPCVFPVLSIKAIGLVEQAKKHPAAVRTKGLVFAAGVISSMLALAGRAAGLARGRRANRLGLSIAVAAVRDLMAYLLLASV
jgi:thiol:disulfide interchange protein